jgi:hypothetical protein
MPRAYSVVMTPTSISAARTLVELSAPSTMLLAVTRVVLGQTASETSEQNRFIIQRVSGTAATGTTRTPEEKEPGGPAATATAKVNCTAEPGTFDGQPAYTEPFNWLNGVVYVPLEIDRIWVPPSGRLAIKVADAPSAALTMECLVDFLELG